MAFIAEIDPEAPHPGRDNATDCAYCGQRAVMFNPYNVDVLCHSCGAREDDVSDGGARQFHLGIWVKHAVLHEEEEK